jgi:hypothetical protein
MIKRDISKLFCGAVVTVFAAVSSAAVQAGQIDTSVLIMLRTGMDESEVLVRAGPPDLVTSPGGEAFEVFSGSAVEGPDGDVAFDSFRSINTAAVRRWHYIPDSSEHDPHLTVITMKSGWVFNIERKKIFSRYLPPPPDQTSYDRPPVMTDDDIVRERLQRTLDAAERYAETRNRLKREEVELTRARTELPAVTAEDTDTKVYRSIDADGEVYYGDRPPAERRREIIDY